MKKILVTAATLVMTVTPAAAAHADTTGISANQHQSHTTASSTDNGSNTSVEQYSNNTVNYEAMYYVKYSASETNYLNAKMSEWNKAHNNANATNHIATMFHSNMGGWGGHEQ